MKRYMDLKPILIDEGRKPPPKFKTRGIQAGEEDFSDEEEYKALMKLNPEYKMVIEDWAKTPIYHILTRDMPVRRALFKYCNQLTMMRLAHNLTERK